MRTWLIAGLVTVLTVLTLGISVGPAAAAGTTASTTTVTDNASGLQTGGTLTFTATVTGSDGGTPTGTVDWTVTDPNDNPVTCPSSTLDGGGVGTCVITNAIAGTYSATANYEGDPTYNTSTDQDATATVAKADSSTTVSDNASGVITGGSFTFTATVSGPGVTPTGSVAWTVVDPKSHPVTSCTTSPLVSGAATCTVSNVIGGTYSATADYGGDSNYASGSGQDNTATVGLANSVTAVTDNANTAATGGSFTFTATVSGPGVTPTGSVTWTVTDPNSAAVACASSTLNGSGAATCTVTDVIAGTYTATADYGGDTSYANSSDEDSTAQVAKAASTTTVTDDASSAVAGGTFAFTATVTGPGVTPTGTVTWTVTDPNSAAVVCAPSTLNGSGKGTCTVTNAIGGTYTATATYGGDANYTGGSGHDTGATVGAAESSTAVNDTASGVVTGGSFTYSATVSGGAGTPTGSITWTVTDPNGHAVTSCTSSPLVSGVASCTVTNALAGGYSATADYSGDSNYDGSSGQDTSAFVGKATGGTAVTNNSTGVVSGGTFTYTATVSGPGVTPTGTVSWVVSGPGGTNPSCATSSLVSGVATCTVTNALAGTYSATATYSGDSNYNSGSPGHDTTAAVGQASTLTVSTVHDVHGNKTWDNTELTGAVAQDTATVTGATNPVPTGTVTYSFFPNATCITGTATTTQIVTLSSGAVPNSSSTVALNAGSYSYSAAYSGDVNYIASTGLCETFTVAQNTSPSPPSISNIPTAAIFGGAFTPSVATMTDGAPSTTSSTPSICTLYNNVAIVFVGVGTCTLTAHTAGTPNYTQSNGSPQSFAVGRAVPSAPAVSNIPAGATEFGSFVASVATTGDGTTDVASISTAVCAVGADGHTVQFVGFGDCTLTASVAQGPHYFAGTGNPQSFPVGPAARGYWLVGSDGGIFSFGAATFYGSMGGTPLQRPVVGITPSASRTGYWLVASDGGIFSFGTSSFYGSIPGVGLHPAGSGQPNSLNAPIVGMVPSITGHGYFMIASDGGVFAFGDAHFAGSCPGIGGCAGKAVSVLPDSTGMGYWLVTNLGAVYAFGDATFYGAPTASSVGVVDAVATPDWRGYWLLYANGVVDGFGDATSMGAPLGYVNTYNPAAAIFPTADGKGYWVAAARGDVFSYGDAPYLGSMAAAGLNGNIIAAFGF